MAKRLSSQLFVNRLSSFTNNEQLKRLFSPFGDVTEARMVVDRITQRPKGFGFVTYKSDVEAQKALKAMNGRVISFFPMVKIKPQSMNFIYSDCNGKLTHIIIVFVPNCRSYNPYTCAFLIFYVLNMCFWLIKFSSLCFCLSYVVNRLESCFSLLKFLLKFVQMVDGRLIFVEVAQNQKQEDYTKS
ncbi:unnamed protein product [Prunus armeniaca]